MRVAPHSFYRSRVSYSHKRDDLQRGENMKARCVFCWSELNLSDRASEEYAGPVKCLSCGGMNELKITKGIVYFINPLGVFETEAQETKHVQAPQA